jgi:myo-inositol-1-phosphate synthase
MVSPNDLVIGGWDCSKLNLGDAMQRAAVFDIDLQRQLKPLMEKVVPLPAIFDLEFVATNQEQRADNVIPGSKQQAVDKVREDIRRFKAENGLDKIIVLWTANTERFAEVSDAVHGTADNLLKALADNEKELAPSTCYGIAAVLEGCAFINGAPQNTLVPGLVELAKRGGVFLAGDDFKSGQTKMKSALIEFFVGAGIKPECIASYNHLGNNDGRNLASPKQFRSKEITKSTWWTTWSGRTGSCSRRRRASRTTASSSSTCRTWATASARWTSTSSRSSWAGSSASSCTTRARTRCSRRRSFSTSSS